MRAHPAGRGQEARLHPELLDLRLRRQLTAHDARLPRPRPGPQALPGPLAEQPGERPEERARRPRDGDGAGHERAGAPGRRGLRDLPGAAARRQRDGLRRPDHDGGRPAAGLPRRRRALPAALPPRAGRRVPGHQPRAVHAGARAGREQQRPRARPQHERPDGRAVRRRRRRPVHLRLPRGRHPQHPRLRGGLPGRHHRAARAELPLHAERAGGRERRDREEPGPQGQAAVDRRRRRREDRRLRRRQRARRGRLRRRGGRPPDRRRHGQAVGRRGLLPDQRPVAGLRGGLRPRRAALPRGRWGALLRAQGGQGRAGLPARAVQPGRRRQPAPDPQHPAPGHRRPRRGVPGGVRLAGADRLPPGAGPLRRGARHGDPLGQGGARVRRRPGRAAGARRGRDAAGGGARGGPGPQRLPGRAVRERRPAGRDPRREPRRARRRRPRVLRARPGRRRRLVARVGRAGRRRRQRPGRGRRASSP